MAAGRACGSPCGMGRPRSNAATLAAVLGLGVVVGLGVGEWLGWPFLAGPIERALAQELDRHVSLASDPGGSARVRVRLLGSVRISAARIEIGAPRWSSAPHMLLARDAYLELGYADLWRARGGEPLRIRELRATEVDSHVERLADGRASWQFGPPRAAPAAPAFQPPLFDQLRIGSGALAFRDDLIGTDLAARFSLTDRSPADRSPADRGAPASAVPASSASAPASSTIAAGSAAPAEFRFDATGHYRARPMVIEFASRGVLEVVERDTTRIAWPITLKATIGSATLRFDGTATDPPKLTALDGRFDVRGPSLAAVGDPLGITLPTTGAFHANGAIAKQGDRWNALLEEAIVGSSELSGAFAFDTGRRVPLLAGRLRGKRLLLADLGPAVGAPAKGSAQGSAVAPAAPASGASAASPSAPRSPRTSRESGVPPPQTRGAGKVLPDRPFDLPSLQAMDANVLVDVDDLDLGSRLVEPLRPLRTHLTLNGAVLTLADIDARTGAGSLTGRVQLDGRTAQALWNADLRWRDVRLERWLRQARKTGAGVGTDSAPPPYITGRLNGHAQVAGQGATTAAILGSLRGNVRMQLVGGSVSHLAVEAAGLDLAQALGVWIKGDDALPIDCTVADLAAERGVLRPRALVLDTRDSTLWAEGSLSLADETLDLRLLVSPKDFSPLALRAPVLVRGTFAQPQVGIEKRALAGRVGAAAALAFVNPLAAVLPFFDTGNDEDARRGLQACRALTARAAG